MSDCMLKQSRFTISLEGYPRVYYFTRRFLDLRPRFNRITGALPNSLQNDELTTDSQELSKKFENNHVHIMTIGAEDIPAADIYFGNPSRVDVVCTKNFECPTLILCNTVIEDLGELGQAKTISSIHTSKSTYLQDAENIDCLIVVCRTLKQYSEKECTEYRAELLTKISIAISDISYNIEIILIPIMADLKSHISSIYETRIARKFSCMHTFLSGLTKPVTNHYQNTMKSVPIETMQQSIKEYLSNIFAMSDVNNAMFLTDLIAKLAHVSKCSIVLPLSVKFSIPQWLCNSLLHEIQFEEGLVKSVSADTKHVLEKFKQISTVSKSHRKSVKPAFAYRKQSVFTVQCLVIKALQKDFDMVIIKAEKTMSSMKSLTTIMNKMMFEIEGYLKQSHVYDVPCSQMFPSYNIPFMLRREIMAIEDVYGMGTIYGQYEIHVDVSNEKRILEITNLVSKLTRRYNFPYSFTIKNIKK